MKSGINWVPAGTAILAAMLWVSSASATTIAYWQFDADGGGTFTNASVGGSTYNLVAGGTAKSQSGINAANPVPNPDTTVGFKGSPSSNIGSLFSVTTFEATSYLTTAGNGSVALNLGGSAAWTFEGWIYQQNPVSTNADVIWTTRDTPGFDGMMLSVSAGATPKVNLRVDESGGTDFAEMTFTPTLVLSNWYHIALTFDASLGAENNGLFTFYVNGSPTDTLDLPAAVSRAQVDSGDIGAIRFAGRAAGNGNYGGRLDEFRISDTVLDPSQFLNHVVPEPASMVLLILGGILCTRLRHHRRGRPAA